MSQDALGQLKHLKTARARWPFPDVGHFCRMFSHWICIEYRTQRRQPNSWIDGLLAFVIDIWHTKTLLPAPGSMLNWPGTRVGIVSNMFQIPGSITLRGHSCIGNSGAVLQRSFTGAIPAIITPTQSQT